MAFGRILLVSLCLAVPAAAQETASITGVVRLNAGKTVPGVFVTARGALRDVCWSTTTDKDGRYRLDVAPGTYALTAHARGIQSQSANLTIEAGARPTTRDFLVAPSADKKSDIEPHRFISMLPDGEEKRRFAVDCMGCHSLNPRIVFDANGKAWDEKGWAASTEKMLSFAGSKTRFPVMPPDRIAAPTAKFLARAITDGAIEKAPIAPPRGASAIRYAITEYDLPDQKDFPHDLMLDGKGRVLVTGMFSGLMYLLDPATARWETVEVPVPQANVRALDVDADGDWWLLCGFPEKIARYRVATKKWDMYDIGMYGHSVGVDTKKRAWFNGHFTRDPIQFGYVDGATGKTHVLHAPKTPMPPEQGSPVPYELRVALDGTVWISELAGNRLVRHNPETGETKAYPMPSAHSGPRRFDVDGEGVLWIPEFAAGKLARFDPRSERFEEIDLPTKDSLPYCARVDRKHGVVWVSQCATDAIARVDMKTRAVVECELPTRDTFIRHLDVDPETGEVWGAYSHSPNLEMRIVRLRVVE